MWSCHTYFLHTLNSWFNLLTCCTCNLDLCFLITEQLESNLTWILDVLSYSVAEALFLCTRPGTRWEAFLIKFIFPMYAYPLLSYSSLGLLYFPSYSWCFCLLRSPLVSFISYSLIPSMANRQSLFYCLLHTPDSNTNHWCIIHVHAMELVLLLKYWFHSSE